MDALHGKSLAEKSTSMAQAWRQMDAAAKAKYCQEDTDEDISSTDDLSTTEKRKLKSIRVQLTLRKIAVTT